jgi:hypothetical protein
VLCLLCRLCGGGCSLQGVGAFGKVFLVRHEPTGKAFALKEMLKKRLVMCKQHNNVVSERRVLQQVCVRLPSCSPNSRHPSIILLTFAITTPSRSNKTYRWESLH